MVPKGLSSARRRPGSRIAFRTLGWGQLWIVARPDPQQFINHELVLATLDLNLLDGSGDDVGPDSLDHAVADADRSAKLLVDAFKPRRDVDPVAHDGVAQALA